MLPPFQRHGSAVKSWKAELRCFFLELWGFSKHHFWGTKYIWVFRGVNSKHVFFENHVTVFFHWNLSFNEMSWNKKNQQILDLLSTQDATSSWICDSSMQMEKVPSKNLFWNGGRLDGDLHPMVKKYKNHQQKANPSFVAPRFFQLNFENLQTHQRSSPLFQAGCCRLSVQPVVGVPHVLWLHPKDLAAANAVWRPGSSQYFPLEF